MWMQFHCGRHLQAVQLAVALLWIGATMHLWPQATRATQQDMGVKARTYDVVSIRPASPGERNVDWRPLPNGFDFKNMPLAPLIYEAYGITSDDQISGLPGWAKSDRYIVSARFDEDTVEAWKKFSKEDKQKQQQLMLQALFADRCQLKVRHEVKEIPIYYLVIAKGGLKMKEATPDEQGYATTHRTYLKEGYRVAASFHAGSVAGLAQMLPNRVDRLVIDKTGLGDKKFDYELNWSSDDATPDAANAGPSIFKALEEQLGLKLEPAKEPVDTFVVEHIDRPSTN